MGSPYLSSNESIILSTHNVIVNTVPAEAILTNERLMLVDARHAEIRPQDIPFSAIETVTIGENSDMDPMLSLSLVTGPGVTQAMGIVFPQPAKMRRFAERDEWAARLKELSIISVREGGIKPMEILPPWVPGPFFEEGKEGGTPAAKPDNQSQFRNPPLAPRKLRQPAAPKNRMVVTAVVVIVILVALAAGAYLFMPSLFGRGVTTPPPATPTLTSAPVPTTVATPEITATAKVPATTPVTATPPVLVPQTGVWVKVTYDGSYSGTAGAPERIRDITGTGDHFYQISAKDEVVIATIQKQDNSGKKMTVEIYNEGKLLRSGSVSAPKGTVSINADLKTA